MFLVKHGSQLQAGAGSTECRHGKPHDCKPGETMMIWVQVTSLVDSVRRQGPREVICKGRWMLARTARKRQFGLKGADTEEGDDKYGHCEGAG